MCIYILSVIGVKAGKRDTDFLLPFQVPMSAASYVQIAPQPIPGSSSRSKQLPISFLSEV